MDELRSRVAALLARVEASRYGSRLEHLRRTLRTASARVRHLGRTAAMPIRPVVHAVSAAVRRIGTVSRPGRPPILYRDGMVTLDRDGVVVSSYYLPFGRRRIDYDAIRGVDEYPLSGGRGYQVHGYRWPRHWYHRDAERAERSVGLELRTDSLLRPVITPIDVAAVKDIIDERIEPDRTP